MLYDRVDMVTVLDEGINVYDIYYLLDIGGKTPASVVIGALALTVAMTYTAVRAVTPCFLLRCPAAAQLPISLSA